MSLPKRYIFGTNLFSFQNKWHHSNVITRSRKFNSLNGFAHQLFEKLEPYPTVNGVAFDTVQDIPTAISKHVWWKIQNRSKGRKNKYDTFLLRCNVLHLKHSNGFRRSKKFVYYRSYCFPTFYILNVWTILDGNER